MSRKTTALLKKHAASSRALFKYLIDTALEEEEVARLDAALADGWALALVTTITTPPGIIGTISKPGHPIQEVFRFEFTQVIEH